MCVACVAHRLIPTLRRRTPLSPHRRACSISSALSCVLLQPARRHSLPEKTGLLESTQMGAGPAHAAYRFPHFPRCSRLTVVFKAYKLRPNPEMFCNRLPVAVKL